VTDGLAWWFGRLFDVAWFSLLIENARYSLGVSSCYPAWWFSRPFGLAWFVESLISIGTYLVLRLLVTGGLGWFGRPFTI
jgi:hypothetical protein